MIYTDLILNEKNWKHLSLAYCRGKLSHALLFHGSPGSGKEGHAIELAALLNCSNTEDGESCGVCASCKQTKSFQHGNIKLILPLPRGKIRSKQDATIKAFSGKLLEDYQASLKLKGKDPYFSINVAGANTILINSIRELKHDVYMSTVKNECTVILIFQAEKLCVPSPAAAHALLKILEEPPERTVFILVTSNPSTLLDTIHSRCQSLHFLPLPNGKIQERLKLKGLDDSNAAIVASISGGNMNMALELSKNTSQILENLQVFIRACFSKNYLDWQKITNIASQLKTKGVENLETLFLLGKIYFRDLLLFSNSNTRVDISFSTETARMQEIISTYPHADWHACIGFIEQTHNYILRNGYLPLMMTSFLIDIQKSLRGEIQSEFHLVDWMAS